MSYVLASNDVPEDGVPVIIEYPEQFPFGPGEREKLWHEASQEEYQLYLAKYSSDEEERA